MCIHRASSLCYTAESSMVKQVYFSKKLNPTPGRKTYLLKDPIHTGSPDNGIKCSSQFSLSCLSSYRADGIGSHDLLPCVWVLSLFASFLLPVLPPPFFLLYIISESLSFISSGNSSASSLEELSFLIHHENKGTIW